MSDDYPRLTRPEPYRPTYEHDADTGLAFAVIVSCITFIGMVILAAALRLWIGG